MKGVREPAERPVNRREVSGTNAADSGGEVPILLDCEAYPARPCRTRRDREGVFLRGNLGAVQAQKLELPGGVMERAVPGWLQG